MRFTSCFIHRDYAVLFLVLAAGAALWPNEYARGYEEEECIRCHSQDSTESRLRMSVSDYARSVHGKEGITCQGCHGNIEDAAHAERPGSGAVDCGECHDQVNLHGAAGTSENRPQCFHCHTKHAVRLRTDARSSVHRANLRRTCAACHPVPCGKTSALSWIPSLRVASHNKQDFSRSYRGDNCVGCHQGQAAHGSEAVLSDDRCDVCHAPLGARPLLSGYMHVVSRANAQPLSFVAGIINLTGLVLLVWGGFRYYQRKFSHTS